MTTLELIPLNDELQSSLGTLVVEAGAHVFLPTKSAIVVNFAFERDAEVDRSEGCDVVAEKVREAASKVAETGKKLKAESICISDSFGADVVGPIAEGLVLGSWAYKPSEAAKFAKLTPPKDQSLAKIFKTACARAEMQNFSRFLQESPSNLMTPQIFADTIQKFVKDHDLCDKVQVHARNVDWIRAQKMGSFLGVAQGSIEENPPVFLEIHVNKKDGQTPDLCLVGKGITFDSGGINIKLDWQGMMAMKSDMGGAAVAAASTLGAAKLGLTDRYIVCLTPLTDNMPDGRSIKSGDVLTASNGKTIEIYHTDAEGRLVLADGLSYADGVLKSKNIIDIATLTGAMMVALGDAACGIFSRSDKIASTMIASSVATGDRVFRMPLYELYKERMTKSDVADTTNLASAGDRMGGSITAAQFLGEFVETKNWAHMDIAGVMKNSHGGCKYIQKGSMTGRPVRTMLAFIEKFLE